MRRQPFLDRQVVLEAPDRVADGAGGFDVQWAALGTLWADLRPGKGRERPGRAVTMSRVPYRITVRGATVGSTARPTPGQRFRDGNRVFAILAVTEADPRARYLVCDAEEETVV